MEWDNCSFLVPYLFEYGVVVVYEKEIWGLVPDRRKKNLGGMGQGKLLIITSQICNLFSPAGVGGILCKKYSFRFVAMMGGFLSGLGLALSYFAMASYHFYITLGITTGE